MTVFGIIIIAILAIGIATTALVNLKSLKEENK